MQSCDELCEIIFDTKTLPDLLIGYGELNVTKVEDSTHGTATMLGYTIEPAGPHL